MISWVDEGFGFGLDWIGYVHMGFGRGHGHAYGTSRMIPLG